MNGEVLAEISLVREPRIAALVAGIAAGITEGDGRRAVERLAIALRETAWQANGALRPQRL